MKKVIAAIISIILLLMLCTSLSFAENEYTDAQYVLYLGTNDQDTNTPVFTQTECLEKAREILIRHFGGYTIQEAHGGWIDNGTVFQEYTGDIPQRYNA